MKSNRNMKSSNLDVIHQAWDDSS